MSAEEGTKIEYYTIGVERIFIFVRHGDHCLKMQAPAWMSIVKSNSKGEGPKKLYLLQGYGFEGNESKENKGENPPDLSPCQTTVTTHLSDWVHWVNGQDE